MNIYKTKKFINQFKVDYSNSQIIECPNTKTPILSEYNEEDFLFRAYFNKKDCDSCRYNKKCIKQNFDDSCYEVLLKNYNKEEKKQIDYVALLEKGISLKHLGKYEEAKEMYIKAIHVDNTHPNGYYNLGKILYILGDYKASAKAYKAAFERGFCELQQSMKVDYTRLDTSSLYIHLGHALLDAENKQGQYNEFIKKYEEGIAPHKVKNYKPNRGKIRMDAYNEYDKMCVVAAKAYLEV